MNTTTNDIECVPGAYWFGISYESDLAYAKKLHGETKREFIAAVKKAWDKT